MKDKMDTGSSRLEESGLVTSGPHHIPGYQGYCPQYKYRYGKTYGKMTSTLINDQEVPPFGRHGLASTVPKETKDPLLEERDHIVTSRAGDVKFADTMIPGYAGFVPCTKNYFGSRFREVCTNSVADLEMRKRKALNQKDELEFITALQDGKIQLDPEEHEIPEYLALSPRRAQVNRKPILPSEDKPKLVISPYDLDNTDPNKTFKSGYTGFVPRSRDLLGQGYPSLCNRALHTFDDDRHRKNQTTGGLISSTISTPRLSPVSAEKPIYPEESGMTPRYTGHIPGVRFRHGLTFGKSTKNTKNFEMPDVSL